MSWITRENDNGEKTYPFARWMSWLFLTVSILLLIFTYYRAEINLHGSAGAYFFKYYLISLAGILFWGAVLRLREEMRVNIVTLAASLVVGLYLVEGGLAFLGLGKPTDRAVVAAQLGIEYDERLKSEVMADLLAEGMDPVPAIRPYNVLEYDTKAYDALVDRAVVAAQLGIEYDERLKPEVMAYLLTQGVDAVPAIRPFDALVDRAVVAAQLGMEYDALKKSMDFLPLGGISKKTTVASNETGRYMIYLSDRYGFNNPDTEWDAKNVGWLLTGDSFAEGVAVQPGEDIAGQIRVITQESAVSLGRSGNGPLMELALLTEYAGAVRPKKVLWIYFEANDLRDDLVGNQQNKLLMRYMEDGFSQNLINRQKEVDARLRKIIPEISKIITINHAESDNFLRILRRTRWMRLSLIRTMFDRFARRNVEAAPISAGVHHNSLKLFAKILTKAKVEVEAWGGKLYFVYIPEYGRYIKKVDLYDKYNKKSEVIDLVEGLNIPVTDIHQEVFADHPDPLALFALRLFGHFNAEGYARVTKAIVAHIRD